MLAGRKGPRLPEGRPGPSDPGMGLWSPALRPDQLGLDHRKRRPPSGQQRLLLPYSGGAGKTDRPGQRHHLEYSGRQPQPPRDRARRSPGRADLPLLGAVLRGRVRLLGQSPGGQQRPGLPGISTVCGRGLHLYGTGLRLLRRAHLRYHSHPDRGGSSVQCLRGGRKPDHQRAEGRSAA